MRTQMTNAFEQSLLREVIDLYSNDLETELHAHLHIDCLACSKTRVVNSINQLLALISSTQRTGSILL